MNILFMTLLDFDSIDERNIYTDLLRKFYKEGHAVYIISPVERKKKTDTRILKFDDRLCILKLKIGNTQKTNLIEKGVSTVTLEPKFISGIKKYFSDVSFHLVLYSTPPITLQKAVSYVKKRDKAITYLMLKDIFPQNALDLGMLSQKGIRGIIYRYFRKKEKALYRDSDYIGCMSAANVRYVLEHNPDVEAGKVEVCPNCVEVCDTVNEISSSDFKALKEKYEIPDDKTVFVYGGNLGKAQGVDFIIECVKAAEKLNKFFVLIVGSGTEYHKLENAIKEEDLHNTKLVHYMPKAEYDMLLKLCDVGMIFLDYNFTIPNFPSRLLAYMDAQMPVLAVVDQTTDIGHIVEEGGFGWFCHSNDANQVVAKMKEITESQNLKLMGKKGRIFLEENYDISVVYETILGHLNCKVKMDGDMSER